MSRGRALGAVALVVVLLVGGGWLLTHRGLDPAAVVADEDATPQQVIEAARAPVSLAEATDGSLLAVYVIADESGERTKGAARLVDPDGDDVVARTVPATSRPLAAGDGFVLVDDSSAAVTRVGRDGSFARVRGVRPPAGIRTGDVLVSPYDPARVYRPAAGAVLEVPRPPATTEQLQLDGGRLWSIGRSGESAVAASSTDGRTWRKVAWSVPTPQWLGASSAHGDTMAVTQIASDDDVRLTAVAVVERGGVSSFELPEKTFEPDVVVLTDGAVVVGLAGGTWWVSRGDSVTALDVPGRVDSFVVSNGHTYAIGAGVWRSTDSARTWTRVSL